MTRFTALWSRARCAFPGSGLPHTTGPSAPAEDALPTRRRQEWSVLSKGAGEAAAPAAPEPSAGAVADTAGTGERRDRPVRTRPSPAGAAC
ncbi:hypothetical protein GCM10010420_44180 [Streptomyces glaucosporus]|uniref:Secreted protein n=1 Tax=Streptomyces glaucosporus TaxID=284044 RepID=A0ABP5VT72_9ACTN